MKLPPAKLDAFLRRPDPSLRAVLFYGPDAGAVREHADTLARGVAGRLDDPFRVVVLSAAQIAADPARLADEVFALSMTGGRRVVRIRDAVDGVAPALGRVLADATATDGLVVLEGDDLGPRSALRRLAEGAETAMAVPCYLPEARDVEHWAGRALAAEGLSADPEALGLLGEALAGDRQLARREIEKLALYMAPETRVTAEHVAAVIIDAGETTLDTLAMAVADGDLVAVAEATATVVLTAGDTIGPLRAVQRHFLRLWQLAAAIEDGATAEAAMAALRPPIFFKAKAQIRGQLRRWDRPAIEEALRRLLAAEGECKKTGRPAEAITADTLMRLARMVARRR